MRQTLLFLLVYGVFGVMPALAERTSGLFSIPHTPALACEKQQEGVQRLVRISPMLQVERELSRRQCNQRIRRLRVQIRTIRQRIRLAERRQRRLERGGSDVSRRHMRLSRITSRLELLNQRRTERMETRQALLVCCRQRGELSEEDRLLPQEPSGPQPPSQSPPQPTPNPSPTPSPTPTPRPASMASQVKQHGITWTFDREYEVGQYINGDYWVRGESIVVIHVDPMPQLAMVPIAYNPVSLGERAVHGSMVNPPTGKQSYDSRVSPFDASLRVDFPVTLSAGDSLVSTRSTEEFNCSAGSQGLGNHDLRGTCIPGRHHVQSAAVLTVVEHQPEEDEFRPPFVAGEKPRYRASDIQWERLPSITTVTNAPDDLDYFLRGLERPWISHISGANSRLLHPFENMLGYHAVIYSFYDSLALALLLEHPDRPELVRRYIQHGIDMFHMVLTGHGGSGTSKHPIIFAGLLLEEPAMYAGLNDRTQTPFRTDYMTYYADDVRSNVVSNCQSSQGVQLPNCTVVPQGNFYHGFHVGWRQGYVSREYEHLDPAEWSKTPQCGANGTRCETYRHINSPNWIGQALSMKLLSAEEYWGHQEFFDYVYRYVELEGNQPSGFRGEMWTLFGEAFEQ